MAGQPFDHRRRSSAAMYDPARDIFTATEDAIEEPEEAPERNSKSPNNHIGYHQEPQSDPNPAVDRQQLNVPAPSRASLDSPGSFIVQNDFDCAVESPESLKEKEIKAKSPSHPSPLQGREARPHISSPRVSTLSSSPLPLRIDDPESVMAAPLLKKRKLSQTSQSPPPRRLSIERGTPPVKKRDTTSSSEHKENGDVKMARDSLDKPTYSKKRIPEKSHRNPRRPRNELSAYSRRDTPPRERSRSPRQRTPEYRERDLQRRRSRSPRPISRSPSRSPPRQRKKPGGGARIDAAAKEAIRRRQLEREEAQQREGQQIAYERGVHDVVRQHYNAVPERGREWRKTDSRIKGLRSFNNWIKSTIIQKFSPNEHFKSRTERDWGSTSDDYDRPQERDLLVLDIGCGKGGDLGKWQQAPQSLELYVGLDPAEISISQARDRFSQMRGGRGPRGARPKPLFHGEFFVKDCFGEWLGDLEFIQKVGIDGNVGPGGNLMASRWGGGGGFDVVSMMFCMHYAFESEEKARGMLRNVAGSLKKGGRFIGVIPNSDVLSAKVKEFHNKRKEKEKQGDDNEEGEVEEEEVPEWGNSIYRVRFPGKTPADGIFRPPFGWKYSYFLEEAVEEVPEYVVPWEAFRAMTEDYNLELQYRRPFTDIWKEEKDDPILGPLSERMGVRGRGAGPLLVSDEEMDAAGFYHAFCFYKV